MVLLLAGWQVEDSMFTDSAEMATAAGMTVDLSDMPVDCLTAILLRVDKSTLVHCRIVCKKWKTLLDSRAFWLSKEETEGVVQYLKGLISSSSICLGNYPKLSLLRPYNRNLLRDSNTGASVEAEFMKHADPRWEFNSEGEDGWKYEDPVVFCKDQFSPDYVHSFEAAFATSHELCWKVMYLDLEELGIDAHVLDSHRPPIVFTESVSNRSDSGSSYWMELQLFSVDERLVPAAVATKNIEFGRGDLQKWTQMEVTLRSYPAGCRILRVFSAGRSSQRCAGHCGVKIAGSQLTVQLKSTLPSEGSSVKPDIRQTSKDVFFDG